MFWTKKQPSLDALMRQAINESLSSENLIKKCKVAAEKAVDEAISGAFSYGSPFRKQVEQAVKEALPIVCKYDMATFTSAVRVVLQRRLTGLANETAEKQMEEVLGKILPDSTVIAMEDFKDAYLTKLREDNSRHDCECYDGGSEEPEHTWKITHSGIGAAGYWDLTAAPEEGADSYQKGAINLRFNSAGQPDLHKCWHARAGKNDLAVDSLFCGTLYGFDAMVFRLYSGTASLKAKIF